VSMVKREFRLTEALARLNKPPYLGPSGDGVSLASRRENVAHGNAFGTNSQANPYDYVLIDCPPSLGLLTLNALVAAHTVLIPLQCEFYALEGLSHLLKTVELVKQKLNPGLTVGGIILTMYDRRYKFTEQIEQDVRTYFGDQVYATTIPRNIRMSEAPSHGKPALVYDMHCAGSKAYMKLASEFLAREAAERRSAVRETEMA
jgi:chromosome partitioning protein